MKEAGETGSEARLPPVAAISQAEEAVKTERCKRQRSSATIETAGVVSGSEAVRRLSQMGRKALDLRGHNLLSLLQLLFP